MNPEIRDYMAQIGRRGGLRSKRALAPSEARNMSYIREIRRAYREFHAQCFWSNPKEYRPNLNDAPWIISQLKKSGGMAGWKRATRLCR